MTDKRLADAELEVIDKRRKLMMSGVELAFIANALADIDRLIAEVRASRAELVEALEALEVMADMRSYVSDNFAEKRLHDESIERLRAFLKERGA